MHFGIVADAHPHEHRVPIAPYGVEELITNGHTVTIERGAGSRAQFTDADYENKGANIAFSKEEAWMRPDMLLRIRPPSSDEIQMMHEGQLFGAYVEWPFIPQMTQKKICDAGISLLAFEEVFDQRDRWPLLAPLSIICGRMLPQIAARLLETFEGGRGKLLMGAPGVAPCNVAIIGGGLLGTTAARMFQTLGARVTLLDQDHARLEYIEQTFDGHITTLSASPGNIGRICRGSDVIILAIHCPEGVCPKIIRREHLSTMQPRTVIIDASITQGGACETSRPTDVLNPTYLVDNIVHYCVPRITSTVARTASRAVNSALVPYLIKLAAHSLDEAIRTHVEFDSGLICVNGKLRRVYEQQDGEERN
jgi:alanine dehydrogenase